MDEYSGTTPRDIAGFLAISGYQQRFKHSKSSAPARRMLDMLFPTHASAKEVLMPYTIESVGNILLGLGRFHSVEVRALYSDVTRSSDSFGALLDQASGPEPAVLVDEDISFLMSHPYLQIASLDHSSGGHGVAAEIGSSDKVDQLLMRLGWKPPRAHSHSASGTAHETPGGSEISSSDNDLLVPSTDDPIADVTQPQGSVTTLREEDLFNLDEPVLLRRHSPVEPLGPPSGSEESSVELVLDPEEFPNGAPAVDRIQSAGADSFRMVQRRPVYLGPIDEHGRNRDSDDLSPENGAFYYLDAQLPQPAQHLDYSEIELPNSDLDVELPFSSSPDPKELGADDAHLSLGQVSNTSSNHDIACEQAQTHVTPEPEYDLSWNYGTGPSDVRSPQDAEGNSQQQNTAENGSDQVVTQPGPSLTENSPESRVTQRGHTITGVEDMGLNGPTPNLDSRFRTPPGSPNSRRTDPRFRTPPGSPPSPSHFSFLTSSARRLPALVAGVDYDIPAPPVFTPYEGGSNLSLSNADESNIIDGQGDSNNTYSGSTSEESHTSNNMVGVRAHAHRASGAANIDQHINIERLSTADLLFQLERALKWEELLHPPGVPESVPLNLSDEVVGLFMRVNDHSETSLEMQNVDVALQFESSRDDNSFRGNENEVHQSDSPSRLLARGEKSPTPREAPGKEVESHSAGYRNLKVNQIEGGGSSNQNEQSAINDLVLDVEMLQTDEGHTASDEASGSVLHDVGVSMVVNMSHSTQSRSQVGSGEKEPIGERDVGTVNEHSNENTGCGMGDERSLGESSSSLVVIHNDDLRDMPYPSSISAESVHSFTDFTDWGPLSLEEQSDSINSTSSSTRANTGNPAPLHLPARQSPNQTGTAEIPQTPTGNKSHPNIEQSPNLQQDWANYSIESEDSSERNVSGNSEQDQTLEPPVREHDQEHSLAWQSEPPRLKVGDHFTPIERELRSSVGPSPFWGLSSEVMSAYITQQMGRVNTGEKTTFRQLCNDVPWSTNSVEDFNLDSDLLLALLHAASSKSVYIEQDTSVVDSEIEITA